MMIGIPRSLLHLEFNGTLARYLQALDIPTMLSPATDRGIFRLGKRLVLDELCLPIKVFMGHMAWLAEQSVDRILIPVIVAHENNRVFPCHMRTRLADMAIALGVCTKERILSPAFRFTASGLARDGFDVLAHSLGVSAQESAAALLTASTREVKAVPTGTHGSGNLTLAILGHRYVVEDSWINGFIIDKLRGLGCSVHTQCLPAESGYCPDGTGLHFDLAARTLTMARIWDLDHSIDGIIFLLPFNCGPDGDIARHMVETTNKPIMTLVLDEHQSSAGMLTRLEAFVDLLAAESMAQGAPFL